MTLVSALAVEGSLRLWLDTRSTHPPLAILAAFETLRGRAPEQRAVEAFRDATGYDLTFERLSELEPRLFEAIYARRNLDLLYELHAAYRTEFDRLARRAAERGIDLIVLYLPSDWNDPVRSKSIGATARRLFERSAMRHDAEFVDLHDELMSEAWDEMTLHPRDSHLSERANRIVARRLAGVLDRHRGRRVRAEAPGPPPDRFGDLAPNLDVVEEWTEGMPFRLITNAQGLRMEADVSTSKRRQRVLILGDSFTYGPHLPNEATFPAILAALRPEIEILNAGHIGYTIVDEADLFIERAQFADPDVVVIQVLDNDVYGMLAVMRNVFGRRKLLHGEVTEPSPREARLLEDLLTD